MGIGYSGDACPNYSGIMKMEDEKIEIKIELDPEQVPYIRTKPIHGSQRGPKLINDRWTISIHVIPNNELMKMLLSCRDSIKIISPESFKLKMISNLISALAKYEKVDEKSNGIPI